MGQAYQRAESDTLKALGAGKHWGRDTYVTPTPHVLPALPLRRADIIGRQRPKVFLPDEHVCAGAIVEVAECNRAPQRLQPHDPLEIAATIERDAPIAAYR